MKIVLLYQSLLGVYGDSGNAKVLAKRASWRGINAELVSVEPGERVPSDGSIYLLGGGEDAAQVTAVRELSSDGGLTEAIECGGVLFSVCAGYQITGKSFTVGIRDEVVEGLGLLDVSTRRGSQRAVGELASVWTTPEGSSYVISGFENHGGYTTVGAAAKPLAHVIHGVGNCGDGTEGAIQALGGGWVIGTYPHGPVLARNPRFADYLLELAVGRTLEPLPNPTLAAESELLRAERDRFRNKNPR